MDALLRLLALLQRLLRLFLVLPEIRPAGFFFEAGQQFAMAGNVKENSAPAPCAAGAVRIGVVGLRESRSSPNAKIEIRRKEEPARVI